MRNVLQVHVEPAHVHFDHSHVLLSFLYPVKGGYGVSHIYIQTITCCYPKKKVIFLHAIPFSTSRCKMEGCENVHSPLLLINTGLMSIGALTKKAKNEENVHFPHGPLLKAQQRASSPSLMHIETACAGYCLHRAKTMKKKAVKHDKLYHFGSHTV